MTVRYTYAADRLPDNKMRLYPTQVINVIGGPGTAKSLVAAMLVVQLNLRRKLVEHLPDHAKSLVWQKDYDALRNQYHIAQQQFKMLELLDGQVQYLVTECSLPQLLYYNEHYSDNICDVAKTRQQILAWYRQHNNLNLLIERSDTRYVHSGRFQDEEQAREIDRGLRALLGREHIQYTAIKPEADAVLGFVQSIDVAPSPRPPAA